MNVLLVIVILVVLIVTHEFGHFIAAKLSGVKVLEFGIGYPPRALLFAKIGDTEYTLNWIPFGGFVRLYGDEHDDYDKGRGAFMRASQPRQILVLAAGVLMNLLVGLVLFAVAFHIGVPRMITIPEPGAKVLLTDVVPGSPADAAGLRAGDQLLAVSDAIGSSTEIYSPSDIVSFVAARGGQKLTVEYERSGATSSATIIPANAVIPGQAGRPALGIGFALVTNASQSWTSSLSESFSSTYDALIRTVQALWSILLGALRGAPNLSGVVGPVGLVSAVGDAAQAGYAEVIALAAFISVNLVVVNLLPVPVLDGGRLVVTIAEAVSRRRVPKLAIHLINAAGIALIIVLMVTVTYNDVARLVA